MRKIFYIFLVLFLPLCILSAERAECGYFKKGTKRYSDGAVYKGRLFFNEANPRGSPCGHGVLTWPNGDRYEGSFATENGNFEYGTLTWASGNKYVGEFRNNKRHGRGTYYYADGTIIKGRWENGELVEQFNKPKAVTKLDKLGNPSIVGVVLVALFVAVALIGLIGAATKPSAKIEKTIKKQERSISREFSQKISAVNVTSDIIKEGEKARRKLEKIELDFVDRRVEARHAFRGVLQEFATNSNRIIKSSKMTSEQKRNTEQLVDDTLSTLSNL